MICKRCEKEFDTATRRSVMNSTKYCDNCAALGRDVLRGKAFDNSKTQTCVSCGVEYVRDRKTRYCTPDCEYQTTLARAKSIRSAPEYVTPEREMRTHICPVCGVEYTTRTVHRMACDKCAPKIRVETKRQKVFTRQCKWCGEEFQGSAIHMDALCCSNKCNDAYNNKIRRARNRKAYVAPVFLNEVVVRDKGMCQLCGKAVSLKLKHPHPMSASIDHIIPISCGGTHEPRNVQLTHLRCNLLKGVKGQHEQLRMC